MSMHIMRSAIEGKQTTFGEAKEHLGQEEFTLANWDYDKGYLDRQLDDKAMVFIRIPVEVRDGELDDSQALIEFGTPFVLRHVYRTGNEEDIGYYSSQYAAPLLNQFQEPIDEDAALDQAWIQKAQEVLSRVEKSPIFT
ncbi:YugN family protein [Brevibacillus dissolubilis]|uniref:YugN family protein n=1 Tax=Brevibacillus dissolubilis TaxID=1844116 RepID=UPI0021005251|nr:YugN family protein [Brevibacillus dissolubilis]